MSYKKNSTSSHDASQSKEAYGLTGTVTGSSGEHLAYTGASAMGTSGASGDMGNEKSKNDQIADDIAPAGSTITPQLKDITSQGTR